MTLANIVVAVPLPFIFVKIEFFSTNLLWIDYPGQSPRGGVLLVIYALTHIFRVLEQFLFRRRINAFLIRAAPVPIANAREKSHRNDSLQHADTDQYFSASEWGLNLYFALEAGALYACLGP